MAEEKNGSTASISCFSSTTTLVHDDHKVISAKISELRIEEVYDPYQNRDLQHPNGFLGAFMHIVKTSLGTGILAIPRAFKNAGLLVGLFGTLLVGIICTHAIHILVKASQKVCSKTKTPSLGFADTAEGVFKLGPPALHKWSRFAKYFVEGGLFCIHYLADAVYLVIISVSLTKFFKVYYPSTETWDEYIFKLILFVPLLICGQVRQLKHLVPFSFIANLMLIVTFGITAYYMFSGISEISIKDRSLAAGISGIPSFFSTVLFSMEGIGTIMPVENSMVKPKFLGCHGVLNSAMMVIISLYASIGFFGYYKFGEGTEATITKNLPDDM
ncbi:proton-coupled amino acid transporter-like protein CG1139 [Sitophilus oryzae]|uniref:Proton-coupled amino acid transporter-like protein CG1139 n=1 Tax=Sitophilus oryzae TaxID=7048 RepID=A0A6J2X767_SITOR|nr:proton-coupled amino acid transporter-like protein CG1139 [Sitophilus oryzae]